MGVTLSCTPDRVDVFGDEDGLKLMRAAIDQALREGSANVVEDGTVRLAVVCERTWAPR